MLIQTNCFDWLMACDLANEETFDMTSLLGRLLFLSSFGRDELNYHMTLLEADYRSYKLIVIFFIFFIPTLS